ncbi:uncharacterized protein LOC133489123 isoform X2 [Phyllopteryx taeniolatus]|uniref:uncharacterized protein LOC133489123 isoform X2 n=1 Tax=Phyllopteryx taeniolatus TaxID=161469 RepID=UPI002AD2D53F|nr:uncharacterized protein LOC133489123 isoform X2 [Phyllopteryx taeniolatus]XP_061653877.1 uncharacterized protein LOC133489123 isoform X2 [Phyllopteryx taeniolatus]
MKGKLLIASGFDFSMHCGMCSMVKPPGNRSFHDQLDVSEKYLFLEQQGPKPPNIKVKDEPEPPHITKEEAPVSLQIKLEEKPDNPQIKKDAEDDITKFQLTFVPLKSGEDVDKIKSGENRRVETPSCSSSQNRTSEGNGDHCGRSHTDSDNTASHSVRTMAEQTLPGNTKMPIPRLPTTGRTTKKQKQSEETRKAKKRELGRSRGKTRINIGNAFQRWRQLRDLMELKSDTDFANFLLDMYEKDPSSLTPLKQRSLKTLPAPVSTMVTGSLSEQDEDSSEGRGVEMDISSEETELQELDPSLSSVDIKEFNDMQNSIIDWEDKDHDTWRNEKDASNDSSLEDNGTLDATSDDSDNEDFRPRICVRTGAALKSLMRLDALQTVGMEDMVHDDPESMPDPTTAERQTFPGAVKVTVDDDIVGKPASIVYHNSLMQLIQYLYLPVNICTAKDPQKKTECQAPGPFEIHITCRGTASVVHWMCSRGHIVWKWASQPMMNYGMLAGDFMLATNILLSGNNYEKICLLFKFMQMGTVDRSTFFRIQNSYCVDTVKTFWNYNRAAIITDLKSKGPVVALGGAWTDRPGFCAQYCTYTAIDNDSKKIISMCNIDKGETLRNSVVMEKEGFMRTFETLLEEVHLKEICTDTRTQISPLFNNGKYKDSGVVHSLDVWHGAKTLWKKIHAAGKQKGCSILHAWNKDICNHFWFCCKTAGDTEEFFYLWSGVLNHVQGIHKWDLGSCQHGPLEDDREKLIWRHTEAHKRLTDIVMAPRWLKQIPKYLSFRSTAELESFHNHILIYASKRFNFRPPVYAARTMLAALDYNHHIDRPAKRRHDGSIQYGKVYNKKSSRWSLYALQVEKDYSYISQIQSAIVSKRLSASRGLPQTTALRPDDHRPIVS